MSGKTISSSETKIEALKLQSSAYGVTIPLLYGVNRISGNLLDYLGFVAVPHTETQGGKGGGVKVQNTSFTYKADVVMGLLHGPILEIPRIWRGKKLYEGGWLPTQITTTTEAYTPPGSGAMVYTVTNAATWLSVSRITYVGDGGVDEGGTPVVFEAQLAQGRDYTAAAGVVTILNAGMRGVALSITYQWASGVRAQTAMDQLGLTFKPGTLDQVAWSALPSGRNLPYSGLALVAGEGYDLGTGAQVENHMFEVVGPMAYHLGSAVPDVDPADMLRAALTQLQGGAGFPAALLGDWGPWSTYCRAAGLLVSPAMTEQASAAEIVRTAARLTNAAPVWSDGRLKIVPLGDEAETGHGATYTPAATPVYDLDDECYTPASSGGSPIRVRLKSAATRYNHWRVEFLNRGNQYNVEIAEAKDAADIEENGIRSAEIVRAHWICLPAAARKVAQTLLQRSLYINAEYEVPLPWHYALIEPADLLTLTDAPLQMDRLPVRVQVVQENEAGDLTITAEDYPPGTASAAAYPSQAGSGYTANYNADPGDVDEPAIFEAPYTLAVTGLEVYAAVRGLSSLWGGCQVWVSLDGTGYKQAGVVYGPSRYGTLDGAITNSATSLAVQGLGAAAQLLSASAEDAAALQTLCYLGGTVEEYVAYEGATLTGAGEYTLADLVRGAHGTAAAAHADAATFVRVDERIAKSGALDPVLVGSTIYFKFTSFNIWGGGQQQLDAATAWPYTITGSMQALLPTPAPPQLVLTPQLIALVANAAGTVSDWSNAVSVATVRSASGADETAAWDYSKTDFGVVSTLGGTNGNEITISAFDPSTVQSDYNTVLLQLHLDGNLTDSSRYHRTPSYIGAGVTWDTGGGAFNGALAFAGGLTNPAGKARFTDPAFRSLGGAWSLRCKIKPAALPSGSGQSHYVLGSPYKDLRYTDSGQLFFNWISTVGSIAVGASAGTVQVGVWLDIEINFASDNRMRLFLNGALHSTTSVYSGAADFTDQFGTSYIDVGCSYPSGGFTDVGLNGLMDEVRYMVGGGGLTASYTLESTPYPDGASLAAAYVDVVATRAGQADLFQRLNVQTVVVQPAVITSSLAAPSLALPANWQGIVSDYSTAQTTVRVLMDGVETVSAWTGAGTSSNAGITFTYTPSTGVIVITAMPQLVDTGHIDLMLSRAGHPSQQLRLGLAKAVAPKPAQTGSISPAVITLAGDTNGVVASYAGAACTGSMFEGGAAASGWSWSHSVSAGLTVSRTDGTVTVTAMDAAVDSATITLTATKTGWTTTVLVCQVTKTRQLLPTGPVTALPGVLVTAYNNTPGSIVYAKVKYFSDGTIQTFTTHGGWVAAGNWYLPTTSGIGAGYAVKFMSGAGGTTNVGVAGPIGSWVTLDVDREYVAISAASGTTDGYTNTTNLAIRTVSGTPAVVAQGPVSLLAETNP